MDWTTDASKLAWQSPDGKVKIYEVKSKTGKLEQTMSKAIAEHGWTGQIEAYVNDKGKRYIRQQKAIEGSRSDDSRENGMAWGNSLTNAANLVGIYKFGSDDKDLDAHVQERVIKMATYFYENRPGQPEVKDEVTEQYKEMVEPLPDYRG